MKEAGCLALGFCIGVALVIIPRWQGANPHPSEYHAPVGWCAMRIDQTLIVWASPHPGYSRPFDCEANDIPGSVWRWAEGLER